jgi:hypothetical protein
MAKKVRNIPPSKFLAVRAILSEKGETVGFSYEKAADRFHFPHGGSLPPQAEIDAKLAELTVEYESKKYRFEREYPPIGDQLDMLYHAIDAGSLDTTSDFFTALKAVKDANPKP